MRRPLSIAEMAAAGGRGERRASEGVERCLNNIERHEPAIRAWTFVGREEAREAAAAADRKERVGGPLHGVAVGIKDLFDVAGWPTLGGAIWRGTEPASTDSEAVAMLRGAGAVIVGKTVTTDCAYLDPPATKNPWGAERTPGGSSSGSAAAVAAGMCQGAIGTQTGGSIIRPAAYCGVAGLKPTFGRIGTRGMLPLSPSLDTIGVIARTAVDLGLMWEGLSGEGPESLTSAPELAVVEDRLLDRVDAAVRGVFKSGVEKLRTAGARIGRFSARAPVESLLPIHSALMAGEAARAVAREYASYGERFSPKIRALVERGKDISNEELEGLRAAQVEATEAFERDAPRDVCLVLPSAPTTAPADLSGTGDPSLNAPWTLLGVPAVTIFLGLAEDGLPVGLQLIGRRRRERLLLATARWCEDVFGPPPWPRGYGDV